MTARCRSKWLLPHLPGNFLQQAVVAPQAEVELRDVSETFDEVEYETLFTERGRRRFPVAVEVELLRRGGQHLAHNGAEGGEDVGVDIGRRRGDRWDSDAAHVLGVKQVPKHGIRLWKGHLGGEHFLELLEEVLARGHVQEGEVFLQIHLRLLVP